MKIPKITLETSPAVDAVVTCLKDIAERLGKIEKQLDRARQRRSQLEYAGIGDSGGEVITAVIRDYMPSKTIPRDLTEQTVRDVMRHLEARGLAVPFLHVERVLEKIKQEGE